ncbi:MAG: N-acetylglucosamine kinase [Armatimonadota bacterium]
MERWIVGVDAGGTRTRALALDLSSGERRSAEGPGANWTVHGPETCAERLSSVVASALGGRATPAAICLCIAGYYPPDHAAQVQAFTGRAWPGLPVLVEPDVVAAWAGAHAGGPGIVAIAGTGSICYGRLADGTSARAGGWGPLFGDEGSGYAIGVAALRAMAQCVDLGSDETALLGRLPARWPELGREPREWLRGVYRHGWGRDQIAALASEVIAAAEGGDGRSEAIIRTAAVDLASQVRTVELRLGYAGLPLALQGGIAGSSALYRETVAAHLLRLGSTVHLETPRTSPLEGAVLLAADLLGEGEAASALLAGSTE